MAIIEHVLESATAPLSDAAAIGELRSAFGAQRAAFAADPNPGLDVRRERIGGIVGMMIAHRGRIRDALSADFGFHPPPASDLIEVLGIVGRAQYALDNLERWMHPVERDTDQAMLGTARAYVQHQPKGVVGNIVPWNFPYDLSVGPLVEMLAAGNRVIIKPSDYTPACGALLAEMIAATYEPTLVHVSVGGLDLARAFGDLPWDHLLYTGSPNVGREIMKAAAVHLTPVTLELGGKNPTIMIRGSVNAENVKSVIGTKIVKNGQMCVSADHCYVPRDEIERFVELARSFMQQAAPDYSRSDECTGIISLRHLDRLTDMLEEASAHHGRVVTLEADAPPDRTTRRMPMSLVVDPDPELRIMKEEIFGPILPVIPYDDLDQVIAAVNEGERPLGLYVFGEDPTLTQRVIDRTVSGGAAINTCAVQGALPSLGFGGVGASGMGRHHGIAGFQEFSNPRGVVIRGTGDHIDAFFSPYAKAAAIVEGAIGPQAA